jgi:hypothetical protein
VTRQSSRLKGGPRLVDFRRPEMQRAHGSLIWRNVIWQPCYVTPTIRPCLLGSLRRRGATGHALPLGLVSRNNLGNLLRRLRRWRRGSVARSGAFGAFRHGKRWAPGPIWLLVVRRLARCRRLACKFSRIRKFWDCRACRPGDTAPKQPNFNGCIDRPSKPRVAKTPDWNRALERWMAPLAGRGDYCWFQVGGATHPRSLLAMCDRACHRAGKID